MIGWDKIGDQVLDILQFVQENQARMKGEAKARGISLTQLTAATITGMIREAVEKGG